MLAGAPRRRGRWRRSSAATCAGAAAQRRGLGRARVAALHPARGRVVAAPAAHRLDRPVPDAPAGPGHADRGDAGGAGRPRPRGQGALHRLVELHRLAGRRRGVDGAHARRCTGSSARRTSTAGSSATSRPTWCRHCEHYGIGLLPVLPARQRPADRQVPARRGGAGRAAGCRPGTRVELTEDASTWSRRSRRSPRERGVEAARRRDRRAGRAAGRASVIAGATTPEQVAANVAAGDWQPTAEDLAELDEITDVTGEER